MLSLSSRIISIRCKLSLPFVFLDSHLNGCRLRGMAVSLASRVVPAQIKCDAVQPRYELGGSPKFSDVEVGTNESLLGQFNSVSFIGNMADTEEEKGLTT